MVVVNDLEINFEIKSINMYRIPSVEDNTADNKSEDDYDICSVEPRRNFLFKFTPPAEARYCSRSKFVSPRMMSKTVPRRRSAVSRYKINRSLNFEVGCNANDNYLSPKSNGVLPNHNLHLSRSAKILKSLNIDCSPPKSGYKKINKTLNFDLTPSPKRFPNTNQKRTSISNINLQSPSITKTPNYHTHDSPIAHETSTESMDENQNQTPSQSNNKKVKKSLSYVSLVSNGSGSSSDFNLLSPARSALRRDLREKIDDIVHTNVTDYCRDHDEKSKHHEEHMMLFSTPKNLYHDFSDNDDDDRPETPKNAVRLIPESMSAIKKSHRKERISGRFANRVKNQSEPVKMDVEDEEERPSTPTDICTTPNFTLRSIKKSHKKDKSRRKSCGYRSEDEFSDTGSLFDYSADENFDKNNSRKTKSSNSTDTSPKVEEAAVDEAPIHTPPRGNQQTNNLNGPITPENRIDYLRRIMTDSIKKSHKKIKDSNKKSLFKSRIFEQQIDQTETQEAADSENRASTPDDKNSSRLLLAQFSSVKKSHKKDKHRKTGFAQRHINMNQYDEKSVESHLSNIPRISITESSMRKNTSGSSVSSSSSTDSHYYSLGTSPLEKNDTNIMLTMSSPNKRKNNTNNQASMSSSGDTMDYVTAEEEFKIFTPIKKRKALINIPTIKISNDEESYLDGRCETPKLGLAILTPEKNLLAEIEINESTVGHVVENNTSDGENENGRATPENQGREERISAFSSIKKSHKKDKWARGKRRSLRLNKNTFESMEQEEKFDKIEKNDSTENEEPQPSTSYSVENVQTGSPMKTPPNGLRAKTYLRLMQTTSIKRSHKKMREKRQRKMHSGDPDLSEDGSLFDENEKSHNLDESAIVQKNSTDSDEEQFVCRSNSFRGNQSDDGSIFGSDDEMSGCTPRKC